MRKSLGRCLVEVYKDIGYMFNKKHLNKKKYEYSNKSDKDALKEDWDNVGNIFKEIMGKDK